MITPPYLTTGDTIALIATARKISAEELEQPIQQLEAAGFKVVKSPNLHKEFHQFSGTDDERAYDLQWALDHPEAKAILIARGGYGTLRIIDDVNFSNFRNNPKWICGFSDVTVLHSHIHALHKVATLHCVMPINFPKDHHSVELTISALRGEVTEFRTNSHRLNKEGSAEGVLVGGNLSLLYALSASASDINTKSKILFIEDLDEYLYHLDRMMMNLKRSGKLEHLKGLIVGGMTEMKDNAVPFGKTAEEIIYDAVKEYNYPVCFGFHAGHVDRNIPLYLGREVKLSVDKGGATLLWK